MAQRPSPLSTCPKCFSDQARTSAQVTLPTTPNTMLVGRYHPSTKLHTWPLVKALTLSGVPRMGRPKAWSPNRWLSNVSKMTSPGVSSTPAISSNTTSRSLSNSPLGNTLRNATSANNSKARSVSLFRCELVNQVSSLVVYALISPPTDSMRFRMWNAFLLAVPLNSTCSMKCASPSSPFRSSRVPR